MVPPPESHREPFQGYPTDIPRMAHAGRCESYTGSSGQIRNDWAHRDASKETAFDLSRGDVIRGPEPGPVSAAPEMLTCQPGAVGYRCRLSSPMANPPKSAKSLIPCFVSQFPLENSQFRYTGILLVSLWNCSPIEPLKSDLQGQNERNSQYFPVYLGILMDETGSMGAASTTTQSDANRCFPVSQG